MLWRKVEKGKDMEKAWSACVHAAPFREGGQGTTP
jgi:hypothetical protein